MRTEANEPGARSQQAESSGSGNVSLPVGTLRLLAYKMRQMRQELDDTQSLLLEVAAAAGEDLTLAVAERAANQVPASGQEAQDTTANQQKAASASSGTSSGATSDAGSASRPGAAVSPQRNKQAAGGRTMSGFFGNQMYAGGAGTKDQGSAKPGTSTSAGASETEPTHRAEGAGNTEEANSAEQGRSTEQGPSIQEGSSTEQGRNAGEGHNSEIDDFADADPAVAGQTAAAEHGAAQRGTGNATPASDEAGSHEAGRREIKTPDAGRGNTADIAGDNGPDVGGSPTGTAGDQSGSSHPNQSASDGGQVSGHRGSETLDDTTRERAISGDSGHTPTGSEQPSAGGRDAATEPFTSQDQTQHPTTSSPQQQRHGGYGDGDRGKSAEVGEKDGPAKAEPIASWHDIDQQERRRARRAKQSRPTSGSTQPAGGERTLPRWGVGAQGAPRDERHDRPASERNYRPNPHGGASPDRIAGYFPGSDVRREMKKTRTQSGRKTNPNVFEVPTAEGASGARSATSPRGGQISPPTSGGREAQPARDNQVPEVPIGDHVYHIPSEADLYAWQREAVAAWSKAGHTGVVEAVTGAGKSRMAMAAIGRALQVERQTLVIVPTLQLVRQWVDGLRERFQGLPVGEVTGTAHGSFRSHAVLVTTMQSNYQRDLCRDLQGHGLLIGDEVHRLGADRFAEGLHQDMSWRLGLTATLERNDDGVQEFIKPYFGNVVYSLGYERALADDVIAPFRIALLRVPLNREESEQYDAASEKVAAARNRLRQFGVDARGAGAFQQRVAEIIRGSGSTMRDAAVQWQHAVNLRRAILADSRSKSGALDRLAPLVGQSNGSLIFTQKVDTANRAVNILADNGVQAAPVVSDQSPDERSVVMSDFRSGHVDAVASPRVLDEGVDVPEADLGIVMAASRSRRQMVQRLGRVIRKKADGGFGKLVVMYAPGTSEDPACYDEDAGYLPLVTEHAQGVLDGNLDAIDEIERFLSLPTLPTVKPRFRR